MRKEREDVFEPDQPTLVVTYGNTTRKHRPLDRDVTILGRAPGCDVGLESPEVAPVHCVIVRVLEGWRLRDCSGRLGTRLNGRSAHDELLHDEDVLQMGTFSFKLHLPSAGLPPPEAPSRQELTATPSSATMTPAAAPAVAEHARVAAFLEQRQAELNRREDNLDLLQRDCDERLEQLKQLERDLADRRIALEEERTTFQGHAEQVKQELAASRSALEKEQADSRADAAPAAAPPAVPPAATSPAATSVPSDVIRRREELDAYAKHLLLTREGLRQQEEELAKAREQFQSERQGAERYDREQAERYEQWRQEQETAAKEYEWRREALAKEMSELREQRSQVVRLLGELREARRSGAGAPA
jgi:pSer/pThr/pTyr-binding forkhead associated (FHA) protein